MPDDSSTPPHPGHHLPPEPPRDPRHQLFADRLLAGDLLVDAYLAAGYQCSRTNAKASATRLRKRPDIDRYMHAIQTRAADDSMLTHAEIRRFLARIVRTPLTALNPEEGRNADLIKTLAKTSSSTRLEKLDPLKAIELDLKLSGQDPETNLTRQLARALEGIPLPGPIPDDRL